ncbi:hypothetical protein LOK49_LG08G00703, partial [Camellia lanceoleosa]
PSESVSNGSTSTCSYGTGIVSETPAAARALCQPCLNPLFSNRGTWSTYSASPASFPTSNTLKATAFMSANSASRLATAFWDNLNTASLASAFFSFGLINHIPMEFVKLSVDRFIYLFRYICFGLSKFRSFVSDNKKNENEEQKKKRKENKSSLLDIIRNAYDLLSHRDIKIPKIEGNDKYVDSGPPYLIFLHPALGPLWEVTRQKFHGGSISKGSELQIEVAEFSWRNVQLRGSLKVVAENITARLGWMKMLRECRVLNEGIDWTSRNNTYWKHDVQRFEALKVILHGNAEFEATDVVFQFIAELEPLITDLEPPFTNLEQLFIDLDPPFVDSLISTRQLFIDLDPPFVDSLISTNFSE